MNNRWSYSRFSTYSSCKNKYFLTYIKELIVIGKESELADKGLSFHEIAEQMNSQISYEDLIEIAKKDLAGRAFDQEKYPVLKAIPRLYQYWQEFIILYEQTGFKLYKENWERGIIGGKNIVGALDTLLINEETKEVRIYDFKTGKTANTSGYKNQLLLYAYLIGKRLGITDFASKIKLFVFFPLAGLLDEETTDETVAKKMANKMMKQIVYSNEDVQENILNFEIIIAEDAKTDWENQDPMKTAQMSYACSWCNFAGSKQHCPVSYMSGCRFPRSAKIMTKEEYEKTKTTNQQ
jgi:hypothetical protein